MTKINNTPIAELVADVAKASVTKRITALGKSFDARIDHEKAIAPGNTSIVKKLEAVRKRFEVPGIAALSVAANVDPDFVNRVSAGEKRFNIYAVQKLADLMHGINTGTIKNQINFAILKSMVACENAGVPFNGTAALGAASDKIEVGKDLKGLLTRHSVSSSTAPTQSSSTMNALMVLGAVVNTGTFRNPVYQLTSTPAAQQLRTLVA